MESQEIRKKFLDFFQAHDHDIRPSSSLIPDDPSVLFTTAGMQQFKKYFTGELDPMKDFGSKNVASIQKCFRTSDIDEVGDDSHLTFFEMLGNFSFGGYWKEEAISLAHEFITKELGLTIDYVTYFDPEKVPTGDWRKSVPKDVESPEIWTKLGVSDIRPDGTDVFWGPTGNEGPCGPTTEIYVHGVEVWNIVFNEFYRDKENELTPLKIKGVDTGMGFERLAVMSQDVNNVYETDLFTSTTKNLPTELTEKTKRVIADHSRGIVFLISDGVRPSNKETGYLLRRLIRRIMVHSYLFNYLGKEQFDYENPIKEVVKFYEKIYKNLNQKEIIDVIRDEYIKFSQTLDIGLKEMNKTENIDAMTAFKFYGSYGIPFEVIKDLAEEKTKELTREAFDAEFAKHQEISRAGAEKKFGGHGLVLDTGELKAGNEEELKKVTRLHTATHLINQALRETLGNEVEQRGSDINPERARFDFTFGRKMTPEELKTVEKKVNAKIKEDLKVVMQEMPKSEAEKTGALHFFKGKYPDTVSVYFISPDGTLPNAWSKEFCGGPHVTHTSEIGGIKILKEEASSAGVRRIRFALAG
jgi:alanyl-tRNA synthetase